MNKYATKNPNVLATLSLKEILEGLQKKDFTSLEVVESCIQRIEKYDAEIRAYLTTTFDDARISASKADELIAKEGAEIFSKFPLLGVPYSLKDNFSTKNIKTTASAKILENYVPPYESSVSQRLKDAGAILLGKTNMDAFAHGSSTETSDFQKTTNPHDTSCVPGGSSGGSASAVASHMCIFSIGSETAGSIRGPASWCGVVGLKPSYGRVSRYGVIAMASSTDCPGPIAKTVWDASYVLSVIAGEDINDSTTVSNYVPKYHETNFDKLTIGVPKSYFDIEIDPEVREITEKWISKLKEIGFEIKEIDLIDPKYSIGVYTIIQRSEVSSNLARFDGIRYGGDRSNFGFEAKKRILLGTHVLSSGYHDQYYEKAQKVRTLIMNDFNEAFQKVDLILSPTMPVTALKFGESDKNPLFGEMTDILHEGSAVSGLPALSIPIGFSKGMPVGGQLIASRLGEEMLSYAGRKFEEYENK